MAAFVREIFVWNLSKSKYKETKLILYANICNQKTLLQAAKSKLEQKFF